MYPDVPFLLSILFVVGGLLALTWSSDTFIAGASTLAKALGISPFIIGMVVIGFGTSAPELCVSVMSGASGHPELSLGNAYGSCSFNISVILGVSALILPLVCRPAISFVACPILVLLTLLSMWILRDGSLTRGEAVLLLAVFAVLLPLYCWFDQKLKGRPAGDETAAPVDPTFGVWPAVGKIIVGLAVLVGSSHFLVWGAVDIAKFMGVSDLVIGLTIVAIGTSLPELASAIASARRGEHEFVLGNIIGSNFFNTLAVVGIATCVTPILSSERQISPYILTRDLPAMVFFSLSIMVFGINYRAPKKSGLINRVEAVLWILAFVGYTVLMFLQETNRLP